MNTRRLCVLGCFATFLIGGSLVLAGPWFKESSQSSLWVEPVFAQTPEDSDPDKPIRRDRHGKFLQELNLNDQQMQQLAEIRQKYQGKIEPLRDNLKSIHEQLRSMMAGTASDAEIRAKHQEMMKVDAEIHALRFDSLLEMREILTPEQRTKFADLMEQNRGRFQERRGRHRSNDN